MRDYQSIFGQNTYRITEFRAWRYLVKKYPEKYKIENHSISHGGRFVLMEREKDTWKVIDQFFLWCFRTKITWPLKEIRSV